MRRVLVLALTATCLGVAACGGGSTIASKGDCTDADPSLVIPGIRPKVVPCGSKRAKSKIVAETDKPSGCHTQAYVRTAGGTVFCVAPLPGRTFRDRLNATQHDTQRRFQRQMDELRQKLKREGSKTP